MTILYIDADACPVKDEVYRVADRYGLPVFVVSNSWIRVPASPRVTSVVVDDGPDVADDWIAERAGLGDVVITADIPLADRALKAGAQAIHPTGRVFSADTSARRWPRAASASTCAPWARSPAGRSLSSPPIARVSCRRWIRLWCGRARPRRPRASDQPAAAARS